LLIGNVNDSYTVNIANYSTPFGIKTITIETLKKPLFIDFSQNSIEFCEKEVVFDDLRRSSVNSKHSSES